MRNVVLGLVALAAAMLIADGIDLGENVPTRVHAAGLQVTPGMTLHTVAERYRRIGQAESQLRQLDGYVPERTINEFWLRFDNAGNLSSWRAEARGADDGELYGTSNVEGAFIIMRNSGGEEVSRLPFQPDAWTAAAVQAKLAAASALALATLEAQSSTPETVDGHPVRVVERRTAPAVAAGAAAGLTTEGGELHISLPYVGDLTPAEQVLRQYISATASFLVKYEVAVVDSDGVETVLESTTYKVIEVTAP